MDVLHKSCIKSLPIIICKYKSQIKEKKEEKNKGQDDVGVGEQKKMVITSKLFNLIFRLVVYVNNNKKKR